jgi:hypothetical protein
MYRRIGLLMTWMVTAQLAAEAQVTDVRIVGRRTESDVPNHVVHDIFIDFTGQYTAAEMIVALDEGRIFQYAGGGAQPPNLALLIYAPSRELDTFVAQGSASAGGPFGEPVLGGPATQFGFGTIPQFGERIINQAWSPAADQEPILDQTGFLVARVTLSDDASGRFGFVAHAGGLPTSEQVVIETTIADGIIAGAIVIPEPSAVVLASIGLMGLIGVIGCRTTAFLESTESRPGS